MILFSEIWFHIYDLVWKVLHPIIAIKAIYVPLTHCIVASFSLHSLLDPITNYWLYWWNDLLLIKSFPIWVEPNTDTAWTNLISFSALLRQHILISKPQISHVLFIFNLTPTQVIWHITEKKKSFPSSQRLHLIKAKLYVSHSDLNSSQPCHPCTKNRTSNN